MNIEAWIQKGDLKYKEASEKMEYYKRHEPFITDRDKKNKRMDIGEHISQACEYYLKAVFYQHIKLILLMT